MPGNIVHDTGPDGVGEVANETKRLSHVGMRARYNSSQESQRLKHPHL
jgi:hypothetical protein